MTRAQSIREGTFRLNSVNLDITLDALYRRVRF